jgi:hypothetical protein
MQTETRKVSHTTLVSITSALIAEHGSRAIIVATQATTGTTEVFCDDSHNFGIDGIRGILPVPFDRDVINHWLHLAGEGRTLYPFEFTLVWPLSDEQRAAGERHAEYWKRLCGGQMSAKS